MGSRISFIGLVVATGAIAFAACGGSVAGSDLRNGGDASPDGPGDANLVIGDDIADATRADTEPGDAGAGPCPENPPAPGTTCSIQGLQCEYGTNWYGECDLVMSCVLTVDQGKRWTTEYDGGSCSYTTNGPACPASFFDVPQGSDCTDPNLSCDYPEGHCDCLGFCGGPPPPPDASTSPTWKCAQATGGCPAERPRLGARCYPGYATYCSYDICCAGTNLNCKDGYWQGDITLGGCP